uniref:Uncharacterized protein n=1 Tax=Amphimedon queenslandica TaxID=400682 RepID=A0A1X7TH24_AMPQE
ITMAANERPGVAQLTLQSPHGFSIVEYQEQGFEYPNCAF